MLWQYRASVGCSNLSAKGTLEGIQSDGVRLRYVKPIEEARRHSGVCGLGTLKQERKGVYFVGGIAIHCCSRRVWRLQ